MARSSTTRKKGDKVLPGSGQPTKLNPEITLRIVSYIRAGAYIETAAQAAGIHKDTFYEWLKTASKHRTAQKVTEYTQFSDAIEKAAAESELSDLTHIGRAAPSNWQAAAWRLERKHPEKYGRRAIVLQPTEGQTQKLGEPPREKEYVRIAGLVIDI